MMGTGITAVERDKMPEFRVRWEIDEDARTPRSAAKQARDRMLNATSVADVFDVKNSRTGHVTRIDFHAAEFGEKFGTAIQGDSRSYDLTREQVTTIRQALRLALDPTGDSLTQAPQGIMSKANSDYRGGDAAVQRRQVEIARPLLDEEFALRHESSVAHF